MDTVAAHGVMLSDADAALLQRLKAIRATVRQRLLLYGLCAVLSGGVLSLTTVIFLDWLLWLPAALRVFGAVLFVGGCLAATWHWVVRPLQRPLSLNAVAGKLERHFAGLGDSLTTAISFLETQRGGSPAMMRRVIDHTGRAVSEVPLEGALTLRPLVKRAATLGVAVVLASGIAAANPGWYTTGLKRYAAPLGQTEWPRSVHIVPQQRDVVVALGDALTLRMRVSRGATPDLRGLVKVRDAGGTVSEFAMHREGDSDFYFTLDAIGGDFSYWFEAGDDSTVRRPGRVLAVKRPAIVEAAARVYPPAYAPGREPVELDLSPGSVRATAGSTLTLRVRSSKPIGTDDEGRATGWLEFGPEHRLPMEADASEPSRLTASFEVRETAPFQIVLRDRDGFENQDRREYQLAVEPDAPPTVAVTEPAASAEVTPNGSVVIAARAEDDYGIRSIEIAGELVEGSGTVSVPLLDATSMPATAEAEPRATAEQRVAREVQRSFEVKELGLKAGDVLAYRAVAADNFPGEGQKGYSQALRLKVIGASEFEARIRDEFALLEKRVRQSLAEQETLRDAVTPLTSSGGDAPFAPDEIEAAKRAGQRQFRLAQRIAETADRFARIAERMRRNQAFDEETRAQVADMTGRLRETSASSMVEAARALDAIDADQAAAAQRERATSAEARQADAAGELQEVIRWMGRWGDFQEVVARTRDLLDRQQAVRTDTLRQGMETVGASLDSLTEEQRAALRANLRDQQQLAREMEQWVRNAAAVKERIAARDPAAAEAMDQAVRLAAAQQILQRMQNAAEAVGENRAAGAALEQRAAEAGLAAMLAALEARQARELAELRKSVERLQDAVRELLEQQQWLLAANEEAAPLPDAADAFNRLSEEQRALRRNTQQLGVDSEGQPSTAEIGKDLQKAAAPMQSAEKTLTVETSAEAAAHQRAAVGLLEETLRKLEQLAAATDQRLMQVSMAVTRRKLEEIRDQQQEVNGQAAELVGLVRSHGRLDRAGARRASKLAGRQTELQTSVDSLGKEMSKAAVYEWVLTQVSEGMKGSSEALSGRKLDDAMVEGQEEIVAQLQKLIEALASIESLPPPDKFAEGPGGQAGGQAGGDQPPVPPVAELIVLKAMQESLRERTATIQKAWEAGEPTEADLRRAKRLGEEQQRLQTMTERVTQQARQGE